MCEIRIPQIENSNATVFKRIALRHALISIETNLLKWVSSVTVKINIISWMHLIYKFVYGIVSRNDDCSLSTVTAKLWNFNCFVAFAIIKLH